MVHITEDLIRRRAEHNDCEIFSLEEVSLHQQDIERIEHIDRWCRDLKILYLQNNLIPRIENVSRLKNLEYLNLALNNIEVIENLEGCESLQKLDLTVNFVGCLSSVESLRHNVHLTELFLVGNPCTEFQGYRQYVVAALPQLKWLDGTEISRSERIRASQGLEEVRILVGEQEEEYLRRRVQEKEEAERKAAGSEKKNQERKPGFDRCWYTDITNTTPGLEENQENPERDEEEEEREFWGTPCPFTPESRLEAHRHLEQKRKEKEMKTEKKPKAARTLITADGRVLNVNEPKLDFCLTEDDEASVIILDLAVFRHLDTSLIDVDVQPTYVRVAVKGKAQGEIKVVKIIQRPPRNSGNRRCSSPQDNKRNKNDLPERLEVDPSKRTSFDIANIVQRRSTKEGPLEVNRTTPPEADHLSEGFIDDPDVPPLI
ncbi:dynein axonemal assembly factor 11 isoform X2 [Acanthochromis polyacanthus]|uniref:dynein axonemal assembly factor 11 isoform X2 n=1 Tax=Acanthochromis polyacanthus TaxID=80966 RepID=UPI0022345622|nr:dynein axonemal assembly factor 11 isoform X2 [Acanthochromis polyacanthus]